MRAGIFFIILFLSVHFTTSAQEKRGVSSNDEIKTIFKKDVSNGGYGAISFGYTNIDGEGTFIFGMKGGWIINHKFTLGLAGYGFMNNMHHYTYDNDTSLSGGYGGLLMEFIPWPASPVHLSFPLILGGGGISQIGYNSYNWGPGYSPNPATAFFVAIPGVELELNIVKFFRLALGVDYRITTDITLNDRQGNPLVSRGVMRGFDYHLALKFGKF